jgi:Glyoxalase/Bleomycin resistance protein/Dioxygenase superfamily
VRGVKRGSADLCERDGASDRSGYGVRVGTLKRVAPIFPVRDLRASLAHYERLGFATREYVGGGYGYAIRDGVEIHLGVVPDTRPTTKHSAYLWVDDADALAQAWRAAGVEIHGPEDTAWDQHEGAHVDPDGNVLRFGSPVERANADESSS